MIDRLPYTLTTGVTATREGLVIEREGLLTVIGARGVELSGRTAINWKGAHELLSYRDGEPWCREQHGIIECWDTTFVIEEDIKLHRLAAILCDDAACFRVLHYCIMNHENF